MADYSFRCYAYRKGEDHYVAYCLDLMLIGEGQTMQAAIADLEDAVLGYIEAVYKAGWEGELIPRRARFSRWIEFYRLLLSHVLKALVTLEFSGFQIFQERLELGAGEERQLVYA